MFKPKPKEIIALIISLVIEGVITQYSNIEFILNNLMIYFLIFIGLFSLSSLILSLISKKSKALHLIPSIIFFIVFITNKTNFFALFISLFHLFLFLIYLEGSLEKFKSKLSLSSYLALFSSAILFTFLMNSSYFNNTIIKLGNSYISDFLEKQADIYYENSIKPEIEDQLEKLEDEKNNFLQLIDKKIKMIKNNSYMDNPEKEQQITQLEKQKEAYLEEYEKTKQKLLNQKSMIIKEIKKQFNSMLESLTQNIWLVKGVITTTYFFLYQIYLMLSNFLATLMLLIIKIILRFVKKKEI